MTKKEREDRRIAQQTARFVRLMPPWLVRNMHVALVGCGAVGSYVGVTLAKMGFRSFELWDDDVVEEANVGVQLYDAADLGLKKTTALELRLREVGAFKVYPVQ